MMNPTPWLIALALLSLLALPGLYLILQARRRQMLTGGGLLLLAMLGMGLSWRLWQDTRPPAAAAVAPGHFQRIAPQDLEAALARARGQVVLVDFYADWCPGCQHWETEIFAKPEVQQALTGLTLLQVDATDFGPAAQASLQRFGLAGLPALISINAQGQELPALRLQGEISANDFLSWLQNHFHPAMKRS